MEKVVCMYGKIYGLVVIVCVSIVLCIDVIRFDYYFGVIILLLFLYMVEF